VQVLWWRAEWEEEWEEEWPEAGQREEGSVLVVAGLLVDASSLRVSSG